jgi:hypothetical protein
MEECRNYEEFSGLPFEGERKKERTEEGEP